MRAIPLLLAAASAVRATFWMENLRHQGISPFNPDKEYIVFRNVRDFGAKGDGGKSEYFDFIRLRTDTDLSSH